MTKRITLFSTPRPFKGPFDIIQRNSIKSWIKACPECEIILFEDEEKTTCKVAEELGIKCITGVECNEFGTPILSDVYKKAKEVAKSEVIVHINTDIILTESFQNTIIKVLDIMKGKPFFMSGRRWDLDINEEIDFNQTDWQDKIVKKAKNEGKLHGFAGMDYWILPINFPFEIPSFVIARPGMDSWLVYKSKSLKMPVIDATAMIDIVHHNHNYPKKKSSHYEIERSRNIKLAGGLINAFTLREADWVLDSEGHLVKPKGSRAIFSKLALFYPWRVFLWIKREIFSFMEHKRNKKMVTENINK